MSVASPLAQVTAARPPYVFERSRDQDALVASLRENGVAIVRAYLDAGKVARLREEVRDLAYRPHPNQLHEGSCALGRYKLRELEELAKTTLLEVGADPMLKRIADGFFEPYAAIVNKVYCHHDVEVMAFNNSWHYDRGLTLKFFFYLNDVTRDNGAFCYDLGSHRHNAVKQHLGWEAGMPCLNYVPATEPVLPVEFEGPAGSLIIFDAAGYHQAGAILHGGERWVVRFHVAAGERLDGGEAAANPYARRNWDFRSGCHSVREDEAAAPWTARARAKGTAVSAPPTPPDAGTTTLPVPRSAFGRIVKRMTHKLGLA